jgi:small-conductance mechanosensitive channel
VDHWIRFLENGSVEVLGIRLVGVTAENGKKVLLTLAVVSTIWAGARLIRALTHQALRQAKLERVDFWVHQTVRLVSTSAIVLGTASIWFDDPARLTTALGFVTAGLAFALQKVVTAVAGYFVILRGKIFDVGDRIVMGGVRGDVLALDLTQTHIMEMGQPPNVQSADPAMWLRSREYSGRIVTVTNARIFDEPVYNYTRDFPYIWEELVLPIPYAADHQRVEQILVRAANDHTVSIALMSEADLQEMQRRYPMKPAELEPHVYYRLTDNWLELTMRFIVEDHGIRRVKDAMTRQILRGLQEAGIQVASATFEVVGIPPLQLERRKQSRP